MGSYRDYSTPKRLKVTYSTTKVGFLQASGLAGSVCIQGLRTPSPGAAH